MTGLLEDYFVRAGVFPRQAAGGTFERIVRTGLQRIVQSPTSKALPLELAVEQEQSPSCQSILDLADAEEIRLLIPAYSLMEPYEKLLRDA